MACYYNISILNFCSTPHVLIVYSPHVLIVCSFKCALCTCNITHFVYVLKLKCQQLPCVILLVLTGVESIFFIVAGMGPCFGFMMKAVLIIPEMF